MTDEYGGKGVPATCYIPGKRAEERNREGVCAWKAGTCEGKIAYCPFCLVGYCAYHFPLHLRREKWIRPYLLGLDAFEQSTRDAEKSRAFAGRKRMATR